MWFTLNVNLEEHEVGQLKCRTGNVLPTSFSCHVSARTGKKGSTSVEFQHFKSSSLKVLQFTEHPESLSALTDAHPARMDSLTEQYDSPLAEL